MVGDVLGTQTIIQENRPIFLGTLPYTRVATGSKFQVVPDNLRWKFRYNVYANDTDRAFDNAFISYTQSTPRLGNSFLIARTDLHTRLSGLTASEPCSSRRPGSV